MDMALDYFISFLDGGGSTVKKEHTMPSDDEPRGIIEPLKEKISEVKNQTIAIMMMFSPANIQEMIARSK